MKRLTTAIATIFGSILVMLLFTSEAEAVDLEPINFTMIPEYPVMGEAIEISFEVINNDIVPANNVDIIVWNSTSECDIDDNCAVIFETTVDVINQDKKAEIEFVCEPQGETGCGGVGERVLTIVADYTNDTSETNENNNKIVYEFEIYSENLPNLMGIEGDFSIVLDTETPSQGDAVDVLAMFQNTGRVDTKESFFLHFMATINGATQTIEFGEIRVDIAPGESTQYNVTWSPDEVGEYIIEVMLDSEEDLEELEEDDNLLNITVTVRAHTPELTLDIFRDITLDIEDNWLESIYDNHAVNLTVHILNQDYMLPAENVMVSFYDLPEDGVEKHIGDYIIPFIVNGTRVDAEEVTPGTEPAYIRWDGLTGTSILGNHTIIVRIDSNDAISELNEDDNDFSFELKVLESKPDITILDLYVVGYPVRGVSSEVILSVFNKGSKEVTNCVIEFRVNGTFVDSWFVSLDEGEVTNITGKYTWNEQQPIVIGYGDINSKIDELNETNNLKSIIVDVAAPKYDLGLISVSHVDVFKGKEALLKIQVRNYMAPISSFRLSVYLENSSSPVIQAYDFENEPVHYAYQEDLLYEEVRFVTVFWNSTTTVGLFNVTILAEIEVSGFEDLNLSNNKINTTVLVKPKSYQLSVEMVGIPEQIFLNETLQIKVSAFNFGREICCECPETLQNMTNATEECRGGAELALYINGVMLEDYPDHIYLTKPLGRATGEEVHIFYWTPTKVGSYQLEVRIDPDDIIDEHDELDNIAFDEVNVIVDDTVVIDSEVKEDDSSLINEPLVWIPLIVLSIAGLGMFAYSRLGDAGDSLDYYDDDIGDQGGGSASKQSGFRYDPVTGKTYNSQTNEVIESDPEKD